ncbi:MAG: YdcF family protein [Patescibacteria group bacterium]|jgi:uncharacterized SAM-binding protein YcdF (DUF218 family)|nr:YdcF family protein [Patescibacteria group bacterium]
MIKKLFIAIGVALLLVVLIPLIISFYLSPQDELIRTDAIVVISGGDTDARVSEGVRLYLQKWAPKIIFSGAAASGDVSNALAMKRIAIREGVEPDNILIEENSKTTNQNAEYVGKILKGKNINSIILITSPYHQRRAYNEFRATLGKNFTIINHSAKDQTWAKKNWWDNANARFLTFGEIMKNFYGLFF